MIGIEAVAFVVRIIKVIGNQAKKTCSLKVEKHEQIEMLAFATFNTISGLVSKALMDNTIINEESSQITLNFDMFTRMKEDLRAKDNSSLTKLVM